MGGRFDERPSMNGGGESQQEAEREMEREQMPNENEEMEERMSDDDDENANDELESSTGRFSKPKYRSGGGGGGNNNRRSGPKPTKIGTSHQYTWNAETMAADPLLVKRPLMTGLKARNLSVADQFNMRGLYLTSGKNHESFAVGLVANGVNGEPIYNYVDDIGQQYTYPMLPGQELDFSKMNGGNGLKLAGQMLDSHGTVNLAMSKEQLKGFAKPSGKEGELTIDLDFTNHTKNSPKGAKDTLNPLAKVVIANSRAVLSQNPDIRKIVGETLDPDSASDIKHKSQFASFKVVPEPFDETGNKFIVRVDEQSLDNVLKRVNNKAKQAAKTSANDYTMGVIRLNHKAGASVPFGNPKGEHGITTRDLDIAASSGKTSGLHIVLTHEIDHNGKAYSEVAPPNAAGAVATTATAKTKK